MQPLPSTPVVIVGAGPVGLSTALGLSRLGVRSTLLERDPTTSEHSKAPGIHVRTREIFRQWGIEERVRAAGVLRRAVTLHNAAPGRRPFLSSDFAALDDEADRPGILILEQARTEQLLLEAVEASGLCDVRFGAEAVGLAVGSRGARLAVREGGAERTLDAEFVVGCDGAGSFVRGALGLPFDGITYALRPMLADVRVEDDRDGLPSPRLFNGGGGLTAALQIRPRLWRIIRLERGPAEQADEVSGAEVGDRVAEVLGPGGVDVVWASRFRIHRRSSPRFRAGRVLLAGDAAHVHSPAGGLGMNGGIQDAHNLAWKLAYALRGGDVDRLLDSYDVERRAVIVGSVSRYTDLVTRLFLQTPAVVREGAFGLLRGLVRLPRLRRMSLRRTAMIDLDYPPSPLLDRRTPAAGRRLPNPRLRAPAGGDVRLYDLLPDGPVVIDVARDRAFSDGLPVDVIRVGGGTHLDRSGVLAGLLEGGDGWILVRPDAHIAWARPRFDGVEAAVERALGRRP